jgi:hypothetical protein
MAIAKREESGQKCGIITGRDKYVIFTQKPNTYP